MKLLKLHERVGDDGEVIQEYAKVDDEDHDLLLPYAWYYKVDNARDPEKRHISIGRNAQKGDRKHKPGSLVLLNRQIMAIDDRRLQVRFRDGDPLNNQKENLFIKELNGHELRDLQRHWLNDFKIDNPMTLVFPR